MLRLSLLLSLILIYQALSQTVIHRINCGGRSFTDSSLNVWDADRSFIGGTAFNNGTAAIIGTSSTNFQLYRTERFGTFSYNLPVPSPGSYSITLHFAEVWGSPAPGAFLPNIRRFNILIEGVTRFSNIDLAASPGPLVATSMSVTVPINDGAVNIGVGVITQNPKISGIVVTQVTVSSSSIPLSFTSSPPTLRPLISLASWTYPITTNSPATITLVTGPAGSSLSSLNNVLSFIPTVAQAGSSVFFALQATNSTGGIVFQNFSVLVDVALYRVSAGGPLFVDPTTNFAWLDDSNPVSAWTVGGVGQPFNEPSGVLVRTADLTVPDSILRFHRFDLPGGDEMVYQFPVANGFYSIDLYFIEIWTGATTPGVRLFSCSIETIPFFTNVDFVAISGFRVLNKRTKDNIQVTDGQLTVGFTHNVENPYLSAAVVRPGCAVGFIFVGGTCVAASASGGGGGGGCAPGSVLVAGVCKVCRTDLGFVISADNKCIFPTTNTCARNETDCEKGCATNGTPANPATVCQGGRCENFVCVQNVVTAGQVIDIRTKINAFVTRKIADEATLSLTDPNTKVGDFSGGSVRMAFHDAGPCRAAQGCIFVRDQTSGTFGSCPSACEFNAVHNQGLQAVVDAWHDFYNANNFCITMNLPDFFYLGVMELLKIVSGGLANPTYRWGRPSCGCLLTRPIAACPLTGPNSIPNCPDTMPDPDHSFETLQLRMESAIPTGMGFGTLEWICLVGSHSLGRCEPTNTGYARAWTNTPNVLGTAFWNDMLNLVWIRENGELPASIDRPLVGKQQFQRDAPQATHTGTIMLKSDMNMFWTNITEAPATCAVTHTGAGCAQRLPTFPFLNQLQSSSFFFGCYNPAFQKLAELGNGASGVMKTPL